MIIKQNQPLPQRPVVMVIYGQPGICKTSMASTAENPLLIDCDRGADRAVNRPDTIIAQKWEDVIQEISEFKNYKTIIIDTAKAVLDDYLWDYSIRTDSSLTTKYGKTNDMKVFGAIAKKFKDFVNAIRAQGCDLIIVSHAKEDKGNDGVTKIYPDVTGSSKDTLYKIADQIGYVCMINGQRTISFEPEDLVQGKNTAGLDKIVIPHYNTPEFRTFSAGLIKDIKSAIQAKDKAQVELLAKCKDIEKLMKGCDTVEKANDLQKVIKGMPAAQLKAYGTQLMERVREFATYNKEKKCFQSLG
jgi:hypothetical protein